MQLTGLVYRGIGLSLTTDEMGTHIARNGEPWLTIPAGYGIAYEIDDDKLEEFRQEDLLAVK
jgi:hypothetical protein